MTKMPGDYRRLAGSELKPAPDARRCRRRGSQRVLHRPAACLAS
jgi:hypothetical protein